MPAGPRLNQRQAAFAARTIGSSFPSTETDRPLASRSKGAAGVPEDVRKIPCFERVSAPNSLVFPGATHLVDGYQRRGEQGYG